MKTLLFLLPLALLPLPAEEAPIVLNARAEANLRLQTELVMPGTLENTLRVTGFFESAPERESTVSADADGRVSRLLVREGQTLRAGDPVLELLPLWAGADTPPRTLHAAADGRVTALHVRAGNVVAAGDLLAELADLSLLRARLLVPERLAARLTPDTDFLLRVPSLDLPPLRLRAEPPLPRADAGAGLRPVSLRLENPDLRFLPGLHLHADVVVDRRENAISVPRAALRGDSTQPVVFVRDFRVPHAFLKVPVTTGLETAGRVEILAGLLEGDEVVVQGSHALFHAAPGTGISLKEALDAAHGHEHNEDGSEITPEQTAAHDSAGGTESPTVRPAAPPWLAGYAIGVTLLTLFLADRLRRKREGSPC